MVHAYIIAWSLHLRRSTAVQGKGGWEVYGAQYCLCREARSESAERKNVSDDTNNGKGLKQVVVTGKRDLKASERSEGN